MSRMRRRRLTREAAAFGIGLALGIYEGVFGQRNPAVLTFAAGLVGYPFASRADAARRERERDGVD